MSVIKWVVDPAHGHVSFKIRHLMISTVRGSFRKFLIEVDTDSDDFATASQIMFTAEVDSILTGDEQRDAHLISSDFFQITDYPQIKFESNSYKVTNEGATISGHLTIKGITKPVVLSVEHGGILTDGYGQIKAGFSVSTKISRKEFGLIWNAVTFRGNRLMLSIMF